MLQTCRIVGVCPAVLCVLLFATPNHKQQNLQLLCEQIGHRLKGVFTSLISIKSLLTKQENRREETKHGERMGSQESCSGTRLTAASESNVSSGLPEDNLNNAGLLVGCDTFHAPACLLGTIPGPAHHLPWLPAGDQKEKKKSCQEFPSKLFFLPFLHWSSP